MSEQPDEVEVEAEPVWSFEVFMEDMDMWMPIESGPEALCGEWFDRYRDMRPDLYDEAKLRIRKLTGL